MAAWSRTAMVFHGRSNGTKSSETNQASNVAMESRGFDAIGSPRPGGAWWRELHRGPTRSVPESKFFWSSSHQGRFWNPESAMISGAWWGNRGSAFRPNRFPPDNSPEPISDWSTNCRFDCRGRLDNSWRVYHRAVTRPWTSGDPTYPSASAFAIDGACPCEQTTQQLPSHESRL